LLIAYTAEQEALRHELREYFADLMTPEVQAEVASGESGGPACLEAVRKMGRDGWLGLGWPEEYGGQARGELEQFIFTNESWRAGVPLPFLTINTVGKTIMEFGSDEQKAEFLPKILAGECHFSIGYTEPGAGTDLASLRTTAVKDGDEWVINGQKIYTSLASYADYIWLAAAPIPRRRSTRGSRSSWSRPPIPVSRGRRSTRWSTRRRHRPTTTTSASATTPSSTA
jgi:alkylation response protein AidB-like acyl-CoA dehydrogenase